MDSHVTMNNPEQFVYNAFLSQIFIFMVLCHVGATLYYVDINVIYYCKLIFVYILLIVFVCSILQAPPYRAVVWLPQNGAYHTFTCYNFMKNQTNLKVSIAGYSGLGRMSWHASDCSTGANSGISLGNSSVFKSTYLSRDVQEYVTSVFVWFSQENNISCQTFIILILHSILHLF
jgi:hypothetical protein